jgi:hypothetical protein
MELPSARGCTHILPREDFGIGIAVSRGFSDAAEFRTAEKHLGVTIAEIAALAENVLSAMGNEAITTQELRSTLRDRIRTFGEEGRKRGIQSDLPLALAWLQSEAIIHRIPQSGRFDRQTFRYRKWESPPLVPPSEDADRMLATKYWSWLGSATLDEFRWFSGFTLKRAQTCVRDLGLHPHPSYPEILLAPGVDPDSRVVLAQSEPALLSSIDPYFNLRRNVSNLFSAESRSKLERCDIAIGGSNGLVDLPFHAILHSGRIVGFWEFNSETMEIETALLESVDDIRDTVSRYTCFIREQLGDFRSYSRDTPKSRAESIRQLRNLADRL